MNSNDLIHKLLERPPGQSAKINGRDDTKYSKNVQEESLAECYDHKETLLKHKKMIDKIRSGELDPQQAFQSVSAQMIVKMIQLANEGQSEKVQFAATKDLLDRAGLAPVQRAAILGANIDPNHSKEELLSLIEGLAKKTKAVDVGE